MKEIAPLLEKLAEKLGTTTEYLWGVLLKQAQVEIWLSLAGGVIAVIAVLAVYRVARLIARSDESNTEDIVFGYALATVIAMIPASLAYFAFSAALTCYINPEYYALTQILDALK